jgi:hypothetical protein
LEEVRVFDHESNDLVVGEFAFAESEFFIGGLARPQQCARGQPRLLYQLTQLPLSERLDVVVDLPEIDPALTEQAMRLAALGSSRLLVDGDFVFHGFVSGQRTVVLVPRLESFNVSVESPDTDN